MSQIQINNLSFTYPGALSPIFDHISLSLDTRWRLGLIGRNGRGKTTFLNLMRGKLKGTGTIIASEQFDAFPVAVPDPSLPALGVARQAIAPFSEWEKKMDFLANDGAEEAIAEYGEIEAAYSSADGYIINESIAAEAGKLGIQPDALARPFSTLSAGSRSSCCWPPSFSKSTASC